MSFHFTSSINFYLQFYQIYFTPAISSERVPCFKTEVFKLWELQRKCRWGVRLKIPKYVKDCKRLTSQHAEKYIKMLLLNKKKKETADEPINIFATFELSDINWQAIPAHSPHFRLVMFLCVHEERTDAAPLFLSRWMENVLCSENGPKQPTGERFVRNSLHSPVTVLHVTMSKQSRC